MDPQPAEKMARKLTTEEASAFAQALQNAAGVPLPGQGDLFVRKLVTQHDAALTLSPELEAWFGEEFPPRFHS